MRAVILQSFAQHCGAGFKQFKPFRPPQFTCFKAFFAWICPLSHPVTLDFPSALKRMPFKSAVPLPLRTITPAHDGATDFQRVIMRLNHVERHDLSAELSSVSHI